MFFFFFVLQKKDEPQQYKSSPKKQSHSVNDLLGLGKLLPFEIPLKVLEQEPLDLQFLNRLMHKKAHDTLCHCSHTFEMKINKSTLVM